MNNFGLLKKTFIQKEIMQLELLVKYAQIKRLK